MSGPGLLSKTRVGFRAIERGDLAAARSAFEEAVTVDEKDVQAWLGLARVRMALSEDGPALAAYQRVVSLGPNNEAASQAAYLRARQGDAKAMDDLISLTKAKDAGFYAYFNLGKVLVTKQDWAGARKAYENAIALEPKSSFPHVDLALVALEQGNSADAIAHLEQAVILDPQAWEPIHMLSRVRTLMGEVGQASLLLLKAIERSPHNELLRSDLVKVCLAAGNTNGALIAAEQLFNEFPDAAQTLHLYGIALLANGQVENAQTALEDGLRKASPEEAGPIKQTLEELKALVSAKPSKKKKK